jgi:hypothetical protein
MAQQGYDKPTQQPGSLQPGDAAPKTTGQRARQGQNIKGMLWVLGIGIGLVVIAYAVMLAISAPTAAERQEAADMAAPLDTGVAPTGTAPPPQ